MPPKRCKYHGNYLATFKLCPKCWKEKAPENTVLSTPRTCRDHGDYHWTFRNDCPNCRKEEYRKMKLVLANGEYFGPPEPARDLDQPRPHFKVKQVPVLAVNGVPHYRRT